MLQDTAATAGRKQLGDADVTSGEVVVTLSSGLNAGEQALPQYLIWSDNSAIPHSAVIPDDVGGDLAATSSQDWANGYLVKNLPMSQTSFVF